MTRIAVVNPTAWGVLHQWPHPFAAELAALDHTIFYVERSEDGGRRGEGAGDVQGR